MSGTEPAGTVRREDYSPPEFLLPEAELDLDLDAEVTRVTSRMRFERRNVDAKSLVLAGDELELVLVKLDGILLAKNEYEAEKDRLEVFDVPDAFELEVVTKIRPSGNTALMGLYASGEILCTQCEPEGFRRITYAPDRPDVLMKVTTRITADQEAYPVALSNGNCVSESLAEDGRRTWVWQDPFPKPSYLFALVAGDFEVLRDEFVTESGHRVELNIYAAAEFIERCGFAMQALKRAMRWDEKVYGREYDLDNFMIVAVEDFNFGAMENKGLNIFNSAVILASPDTATDASYARIEAVIAHEYFHNWSGNRVTCRDWFQLSLKEGFTVFRDHEFSSDMNSRTLRRIEAVNFLRDVQFAEDAGPLAHPVRPDSYMEISNFYTSTVYEKGAELVRMLHTLLGPEGFRRGSDVYFERFDGQAVTIDDFVDAMSEANGIDLEQFRRWYGRAGTPRVSVEWGYRDGVLTMELEQSGSGGCEGSVGGEDEALGGGEALHIPLAFGLIDESGRELLGEAGRLQGWDVKVQTSARVENPCADGTLVLHLTEPTTEVTIDLTSSSRVSGTPEVPTLSLLRGFSAPIILNACQSPDSLAFLAQNDNDGFSRWDAMQTLYSREIQELRHASGDSRSAQVSERVIDLVGELLDEALCAADDGEHKAVLAAMLRPPSESTLLGQLSQFDVEGVYASTAEVRRAIAREHRDRLRTVFEENEGARPYRMNGVEAAKRSLRHLVLGFWAELDDPVVRSLIQRLLQQADNLTDRLAGLSFVVDSEFFDEGERSKMLGAFAERWSHEKLVMDRWYAIQAGSRRPRGAERVMRLEQRQDFVLTNPNRVSSLYGAFARNGLLSFHDPSGSGYQLIRDRIMRLSSINPQGAARLAVSLTQHRRLDPERAAFMRTALESIRATPGIPKDVLEIVSKAVH